MRRWIMRSGYVVAFGLVAACGTDDHDPDDPVDCAKETGADVFVVGLEKLGIAGVLDFKMMSAEPAPPARGDNKWVFQINQMAGGTVGAPMDGAALTVTPFMPLHQHGSPIEVSVSPLGTAGQYELSPVNLWMPGVWETTIRASSGSTSDRVVYRFCVN